MRGWSSALAVLTLAGLSLHGAPAHAEARPDGWKTESTAFAYSLFGTGLPIAAAAYIDRRDDESDLAPVLLPIAAGIVFGPSLGHFYAKQSGRAWTGIAVRGVGVAAMWGAVEAYDHADSDDTEILSLGLVCGVVAATAAVVDIFGAPTSARKHNQAQGWGALHLGPALIGGAAPGLRVAGAF